MILPETFFADSSQSKMDGKTDVQTARERFVRERSPNLDHLMQLRYNWMNAFLKDKKVIFELGAGAGLSKFYITNPNFKLTDVTPASWIDQVVDAQRLPFADASVDALVCSAMLHHLPYPTQFFKEAERALKPGGLILVVDAYASFFLKLVLYVMKHEGWSEKSDVFNDAEPANDPKDPWSGNNAIPKKLFENPKRFEAAFPDLKIKSVSNFEFFSFLLSGGVTAKVAMPRIPKSILRIFAQIDRFLILIFPKVFALGIKVIIEKKKA